MTARAASGGSPGATRRAYWAKVSAGWRTRPRRARDSLASAKASSTRSASPAALARRRRRRASSRAGTQHRQRAANPIVLSKAHPASAAAGLAARDRPPGAGEAPPARNRPRPRSWGAILEDPPVLAVPGVVAVVVAVAAGAVAGLAWAGWTWV